MNFKQILESKPHNSHYLKKYVNFIESKASSPSKEASESHHICPKANDLFPEFNDLRSNSWNVVKLTREEHVIAHLYLHKAFGGSQTYAYFLLRGSIKRTTNKQIMAVRKAIGELNAERGKHLASLGIHNAQIEAKEGRHYWQSEEYKKLQSERQRKLVATNSHIFQTENSKTKTSERMRFLAEQGNHPAQLVAMEGKHHWQSESHIQATISKNKSDKMREAVRQKNLKLSGEGKHQSQTPESKEKFKERLRMRWEKEMPSVCPHCSKTGKGPNMKRYHFQNCKKLSPQNQTLEEPIGEDIPMTIQKVVEI